MNPNNEEIQKVEDFNTAYKELVEKYGLFYNPAVITDETGVLKLTMQIYKKNLEEKDDKSL